MRKYDYSCIIIVFYTYHIYAQVTCGFQYRAHADSDFKALPKFKNTETLKYKYVSLLNAIKS